MLRSEENGFTVSSLIVKIQKELLKEESTEEEKEDSLKVNPPRKVIAKRWVRGTATTKNIMSDYLLLCDIISKVVNFA